MNNKLENIERDLLHEIEEKYDSFTKVQLKIADYFKFESLNFEKNTFAYISKKIGVSDSSLKKFVALFGFSNISDFLALLKNDVVTFDSDNIEKKNKEKQNIQNIDRNKERCNLYSYENSSEIEINSIKNTAKLIKQDSLSSAVETISTASKVYILGIRNCYPIAQILSYYLKLMGIDTVLISTMDMNEIFEQLIHIKEKDVVFGIAFENYSLRTLRALEYANSKKATIITLTDGEYSPMNMYSSCNLWAEIGKMSIVDSMIGPLSVINTLVANLAERLGGQVKANIEELERVWDNNDVHGNDDMISLVKKDN